VPSHRLQPRAVERVWGRRDLPPGFPALPGAEAPIGEIWFDVPAASPLLVKHLFTAEKLSVQVHPAGKDEAWFVLSAEPGAAIGIGLREPVSAQGLRAAALDGSIERLVDWRSVSAGDFFYSPAGTIHAVGGGLDLIEIQQSLDCTYRLYDYGRGRPLHLDQAIAVAARRPWSPPFEPVGRVLAAGGAFSVERWTTGGDIVGDAVVVPLASGGSIDRVALAGGGVWLVEGGAAIAGDGIDLLVACSA
jgi:mannose-6-phosphate isomerase